MTWTFHDAWYQPIVDAFRTHLEEDHPEKYLDNQEELGYAEESLHYDQRKDGEAQIWRCCWADCPWKIEWIVEYRLSHLKELKQNE
jgi:hypothetical protein